VNCKFVPVSFHYSTRPNYRYFGKIQDKDEEYYSQFQIVICGLDSIEARRWINAMLVNLVDDESPESLIPMVDGGTEGKHLAVAAEWFQGTDRSD
jgi:molybdopterin/thiamine biosynthesis adenylyltransferase